MQLIKTNAKRRTLALFVTAIMALTLWTAVPLQASADVDSATNLTYTVSSGNATITGYNGSDKATMTSIEIPATVGIESYPVTSTAANIFSGCTALTTVIIPDSMTDIHYGTFNTATALTTITVGNDNPNYSSVDGVLFNKEMTTLIRYPEGKNDSSSYSVPENVTNITTAAFSSCVSLNNTIVIPSTVSSIEEWAFASVPVTTITVNPNNQHYSSVDGVLFNKAQTILVSYPSGKDGPYTIPDSVTSIGQIAFFNNKKLTSVTIPGSVTNIERYAFYGCNNAALISITIPESVKTIEPSTFDGCTSLTSINIPDGVTSIGLWAFHDCTSLATVSGMKGVTSIGDTTFGGCTSLTSITIPEGVTSIANSAFSGCSNLTEVTILNPDDMDTFGTNVFYNPSASLTVWCYDASAKVKTYVTGLSKTLAILVDGIKLSEDERKLEIGEDETLTVDDYLPAGQAEITTGPGGNEPAPTWHSSNLAVATVDSNTGEVTAVANGTALITATITPPKSGIPVTGTCEVTVVPDDAEPGDLYGLTVVDGKFDALNIAGAKMSIIANPAPSGQAFDTWEVTNGTDGNFFGDKNSATTVLIMPAENITVKAKYKTVHALTMLKGTDNTNAGPYAEGDVVSITANAPEEQGKVFDTWTSDPTGVVFTNANSPTTTFAMPQNPVTITATYKIAPPPPTTPTTYAVTVNGGTGGGDYAENATVSITANAPANGKVFDTWTSSDVTFADPTSVTTTFTMPAKAVSVTATYKDDPKDSDGDGVPDYVEEEDGTDPADSCDFKDTDEDGVPDYIETKDGTDPNDKNSFKDTNSDGIPDYVQEHPEPVTEVNGWVYANGMWKFFIDDVAQTGWLYDDAWYYLDADGIMQTGWVYDGGIWYYLSGNGAMKTGWVRTDGSWYYLKGNGAMVAAKWLHDTDGSWYYLSGNGKMLTGKQTVGGKTYTFKVNGVWVS